MLDKDYINNTFNSILNNYDVEYIEIKIIHSKFLLELYARKDILYRSEFIIKNIGDKLEEYLNSNYYQLINYLKTCDAIIFIDKSGTYLHEDVKNYKLDERHEGELIKWDY